MHKDLNIRYLGTAAAEGIPALFCNCDLCRKARSIGGKDIRTRSQCLLNDDLLIDFPPDTYHHLLVNNIIPEKIKNIIVTHSHQDHFYPEDLCLYSPWFTADIKTQMNVYGNKDVFDRFSKTVEREYAKQDMSKYISFKIIKCFDKFTIGSYTITALRANHKIGEECLIYDIEYGGHRILYANDTGIALDGEIWDYFNGVHYNVVSMDCTGVRKEVKKYHMGLPDNVKFINKLMSIGAVDQTTKKVITHFSHFGGLSHNEIETKAAPHDFITAYDGMSLTI